MGNKIIHFQIKNHIDAEQAVGTEEEIKRNWKQVLLVIFYSAIMRKECEVYGGTINREEDCSNTLFVKM